MKKEDEDSTEVFVKDHGENGRPKSVTRIKLLEYGWVLFTLLKMLLLLTMKLHLNLKEQKLNSISLKEFNQKRINLGHHT